MEFVYENSELEQAIARARSLEEVDAALQRVSALVPTFMAPEIRGRRMFCPGLDGQARELVRRLNLPDVQLEKSNDVVVIVATRFYATGGHTKVAHDIARLIGPERTSVIFTDIYRQLRPGELIGARADLAKSFRSGLILNAATQPEKIIELYMILAAIRPTRVFLMGNHMDMVATAACWPFRRVVDYVHHADHMPTLGATLPWSGHADLTYTCHLACERAGLNPVYAGMRVDLGEAPSGARPSEPHPSQLRIATCGALHKYRQPARYRWTDFAVAALRRHGSEIVHIGPFDQAFADDVRGALEAAGLDPQRYRFTGPAPDLRQALVREGADLYLASYPDSGGRAILEAMSVGAAPIVPIAEEQGELLHCNLPFDTWIPIVRPEETAEALDKAMALRATLQGEEGRAILAREFSRFDDFVARRTPPPA